MYSPDTVWLSVFAEIEAFLTVGTSVVFRCAIFPAQSCISATETANFDIKPGIWCVTFITILTCLGISPEKFLYNDTSSLLSNSSTQGMEMYLSRQKRNFADDTTGRAEWLVK